MSNLPKPGTKVFIYHKISKSWHSGIIFEHPTWDNCPDMFNVHLGGINTRVYNKDWNNTVLELTKITNILYGPWTDRFFNFRYF